MSAPGRLLRDLIGAARDARARVRTPTVLQMEAVECGAASLGIMLGYFGKPLPLEELRATCGVSRDGSKASNVVRAARHYGLEAKGMRLEVSELAREQLPVIVFWEFNHFLVVEGVGAETVYLNDPAAGPRKVSRADFEKSYTGVALVMRPAPGFTKGGKPPSLSGFLARRLGSSRAAFAYLILASLALAIPGIAVPAFMRIFVDDYLVSHLTYWILALLVGMALTAVLRTLITSLQQHYLLRLEMKLSLVGSAQFFWHVLRLPLDFFNQRYAGDVSERVTANDRIASLLSGELATNVVNILSMFLYACVMFMYDWRLTLVSLGLFGLNGLALRRMGRLRTDQNIKLAQDRGKLISTLFGGIQTIETIKASGAELDFFTRWSGYKTKTVTGEQHLEAMTRFVGTVPVVVDTLVTAAILGMGGARVMSGSMTVGMLVAFLSLMASFSRPIVNLMALANRIQEIKADMVRTNDVLQYPLDPALARQSFEVEALDERLDGSLALRGLSFGYSRLEPPLIEDFSLEIRPGRRVALVGGSGSGKSTVAKLIAGLYRPWGGEILVGGVPRGEIAPDVLSAYLATVDQEIHLFAGSVRENISLWDESIPDEDILAAAKDADLHRIIAERSDDYDGPVYEAGRNYSGGQIQRFEIARALALNPRILVLDEATSALDPLVEKTIDDNIRARGCACLVIAHRLSTIRDSDEIIVMQQGKIAERGTHDALMARDGLYAELIRGEAA